MTTRLANPYRPDQGTVEVIEPDDYTPLAYPAVGNNRTWMNGDAPVLFSNMAGDKQIGLIFTAAWDVKVFIRDLTTDTITSTQSLSGDANAVAGMNLPINPVDAHWGAGILWDAEGYVWIAGNSHSKIAYGNRPNGGICFIRSATPVTTTLTGVTWVNLCATYPPPGWPGAGTGTSPTGVNSHTYHQFERLPDGTSLHFVDQEDTFATSRGRDIIGFYKPPGTLNGWVPLVGQGEFQTSEQDMPQGTTPDRSYRLIVRVQERPSGPRVWYLGSWRLYDQYVGPPDGGPGPSAMKPFAIYSDNYRDPNSWKAVDGTSVSMPASWTTTGGITNTGATINTWNATVNAYTAQWILAYAPWVELDPNGYPHYITNQDSGTNYLHHWWNGTAWQVEACHSELTSLTSQPFLVGTDPTATVCAWAAVGTRLFLHGMTSNTPRVRQGPSVTDGNFSIYGDPIRARKGIFDIVLPDGDTPLVATFGNHSRRTAS